MASMTTASALVTRAVVCGVEQQRDVVRASRETICSCREWGARQFRTTDGRQTASDEAQKVKFRVKSLHGFGAGAVGARLPQWPWKEARIAVTSGRDDEFLERAENAADYASEDNDLGKQAQIDLQLPRRRLLVEFTCNVCQTRTQRLVNPDAYQRGTIYVQCGGCEAYHQLVDNLGLVVEYDFRKETDSNSS